MKVLWLLLRFLIFHRRHRHVNQFMSLEIVLFLDFIVLVNVIKDFSIGRSKRMWWNWRCGSQCYLIMRQVKLIHISSMVKEKMYSKKSYINPLPYVGMPNSLQMNTWDGCVCVWKICWITLPCGNECCVHGSGGGGGDGNSDNDDESQTGTCYAYYYTL